MKIQDEGCGGVVESKGVYSYRVREPLKRLKWCKL